MVGRGLETDRPLPDRFFDSNPKIGQYEAFIARSLEAVLANRICD